MFGFGCAPSGGSFADVVDRHFEVVPESSAGYPELVAKTTLRNLRADFTQAARNLHQDCAKAAIASGCTRVNGVDVYWAVGSATIHAENAILLVTADDGIPPGNASATATDENSVVYAIPGEVPRK